VLEYQSNWVNQEVKIPESYFVHHSNSVNTNSNALNEPILSTSNGAIREGPCNEISRDTTDRNYADMINDPKAELNEPLASTSSGITRPFDEYSVRQQFNIVRNYADMIKDPRAALLTARALEKGNGEKLLAKKINEIIHSKDGSNREENKREIICVDADRYLAHMINTSRTPRGSENV